MGVCVQCRYFRRVKPPSQLLAALFATTAHADISQALNKIVEDESKQRDEESQYKRSQAAAGKSAWAYRPVMSDYCALHEAKGEYHILEVLNAGLQCKDFVAGKPDRRACAECAHRKPAEGAAKDRTAEDLYGRMVVQATSAKASTSQPEALLKAHREGTSARKAFELASIYSAKGVLASPPSYADSCTLLSGPDEFVICALQNPHHTCDQWQGTATAALPAAAPVSTFPLAAPPPTAAMMASAADELVVPGPEPLTQSLADKFTSALAWILDVNIPAELAGQIRASLAADWKKGDAKTIEETQQFAAFFEQISVLNVETRDALREEHQPQFVAGIRQQHDPVAAALIRLYDRANAPIAMGNPPLTREIANCYFDLMGLIHALRQGFEWQPLPEPMKLAYAHVLATQYPTLPPEQQAWFGTLPRGWTQVRAAWKNTPPEQRDHMRMEILAAVGVMPLSAASMAPAPANSAPMGYPEQPASPVAAAPASHEKTSDDLVKEMLAADRAEEERLQKENPELALQAKLQNSARNAQLLSNMMQMRHESMMTIARNIR